MKLGQQKNIGYMKVCDDNQWQQFLVIWLIHQKNLNNRNFTNKHKYKRTDYAAEIILVYIRREIQRKIGPDP